MPSESTPSTGSEPSTPPDLPPLQPSAALPAHQVAGYAGAAPDLMLALAADASVLWCAPGLGNPLGLPPGMQPANAVALLHPEDLEAATAAMAVGDAHPERLIPANFRLRTSDGEWRWFEMQATYALDDPSVGAVVVVARSLEHRVAFEAAVTAMATGASVSVVASHLALGLSRPEHQRHGAITFTADDGAGRTVVAPTLPDILSGRSRTAGDPGLSPGPWQDALTRDDVVIATDDELPAPVAEAAAAMGLRTCVAIPVPDPGAAHPAAVLIWLDDPGVARSTVVWANRQAAPLLALALQRRTDNRRLVHAATHDSLTGLANRGLLLDRIAALSRPDDGDDEPLALLTLDLDGFKSVNARRGLDTGDHVLAAIADRLRRTVQPRDMLARVGGDEFAVLRPGIGDAAEAGQLAEELVEAVRGPVLVGAHAEQLGVSIGIALSPPVARDHLLPAADEAMYDAKAAGRNRWRLAGETLL